MSVLTFAVGDIHGCDGKLASLLAHCVDHAGPNTFRIVFLGDYVDRGPGSRMVVESLMTLQAGAAEQIVCLKGNHEDMLLAAAGGDDLAWLRNGGEATLASYGVSRAADIPAEHLAWLATLPLVIADAGRFFVHAGVQPGIPLQEQSKDDLLWIREPFLSDPRDHGLYIVHGHTPLRTGVPDMRRNRLDLDTGAYFGGPLTAAVFDENTVGPMAFITDDGVMTPAAAPTSMQRT
jgi:serine/threonine protein phosphatase 1